MYNQYRLYLLIPPSMRADTLRVATLGCRNCVLSRNYLRLEQVLDIEGCMAPKELEMVVDLIEH